MTACRLPSPPATTIGRLPARCRALSSSPGFEVVCTSTEHRSRRTRSAVPSDSSSAVPASALLITRSGSIAVTLSSVHVPAIAIIGAQWGDEGKGKATDVLGSRVDYVVKFNGGNNAGHTVVIRT